MSFLTEAPSWCQARNVHAVLPLHRSVSGLRSGRTRRGGVNREQRYPKCKSSLKRGMSRRYSGSRKVSRNSGRLTESNTALQHDRVAFRVYRGYQHQSPTEPWDTLPVCPAIRFHSVRTVRNCFANTELTDSGPEFPGVLISRPRRIPGVPPYSVLANQNRIAAQFVAWY